MDREGDGRGERWRVRKKKGKSNTGLTLVGMDE